MGYSYSTADTLWSTSGNTCHKPRWTQGTSWEHGLRCVHETWKVLQLQVASCDPGNEPGLRYLQGDVIRLCAPPVNGQRWLYDEEDTQSQPIGIGAKYLLQLEANVHMKKWQSVAIFKRQVSQHAIKEVVTVCGDTDEKLLGNVGNNIL